MKRSTLFCLAVGATAALTALPALAASPTASKRVIGQEGGATIVEVRIAAADITVFGLDITSASGSITDIVAPKGWVGLSSGTNVIFRTGDKPIRSGSSVTFRIYTTDASAGLNLAFRDDENAVRDSKTL